MEFEVLVSAFAWFVGSFICGVCGLGAAIVAMPIMMLVMPVREVILVSSLTAVALTIAMAVWYARHCSWKSLLWMAVGIVPGSFLGLHALKTFSEASLEMAVGCLLVFCVLGLQFMQNRVSASERPSLSILTGLAGGALGTSIVIDGPAIALYGLVVKWPPVTFLGTTSVFFFFRNTTSALLQYQAGLFTDAIYSCALYSIPAALVGFALSVPVVRRIDVRVFRLVVKGIIVLAGVTCLWKGLTS